MSRLFTLFVLGGAGLLLTPLAASAQFPRVNGIPIPIIPPARYAPVPFFPGPVYPSTPTFWYGSAGYLDVRTAAGGFTARSSFAFVHPAPFWLSPWPVPSFAQGLYPIHPFTQNSFTQSAPYFNSNTYGGGTGLGLTVQNTLENAQREATLQASLSSGGVPKNVAAPLAAVPDMGPVPADVVRRAPDAVKVASGEALNNVLKEVVRAESKTSGPSAYIPPNLIKDVRFAGSPQADLLNFVRANRVDVPAAFDAPALASARGELAREFASVAETLRNGKSPDGASVTRLEKAVRAFEDAAAPVVKALPAAEATEAKAFLTRLSAAVKLLDGPSANGLVVPNWETEGLTGAELVKHMAKYKLQFGPAPRGAEGAYDTVHGNLATYLFVLTKPKK